MFKIDLDEQQTRTVLEGLACMEAYLQALIPKTQDQDDRIDVSNDLLYAASFRKHLEAESTKIFGPSILIQLYPKSDDI